MPIDLVYARGCAQSLMIYAYPNLNYGNRIDKTDVLESSLS